MSGPIAWRAFGRGPRKAVALHCSLAHAGEWAGVGERLAERLTIAACDLPGHGRSPDWDGRGDFIAGCAREAAGGIGDGADLIGHSGGAVAAMQIAAAMPERVRTLTLIEPVFFAAARGSPEAVAHEAAFAPVAGALAAGNPEAAARLFTADWGTGETWDAMEPRQRAYITARMGLIAAGLPALVHDSGGLLEPGVLERLEMPVLLIRGTASPPVVEAIAEGIAARLPDVGVAVIPGAGHMAPVTHPDAVAGLIGVNLDRG